MTAIDRLRWDAWNVEHIARHEVTPREVEEVCAGPFIAHSTHTARLLLIGPTLAERMLAVVLAQIEAGTWYTITARPTSGKERRLYEAERRGSTP
ncbi:MAG: BrnT family toxin [Vulcanimicrobiaceae bacterium]